jgi:hypothetical protein
VEIIDQLRAEGGTVKLIWAINRNGDTLGEVPEEVRADPFPFPASCATAESARAVCAEHSEKRN